MALYTELRGLFANDELLNRTEVAVVIAAQNLAEGATPTDDEKIWVAQVLGNPKAEARKVLMFVLAANNGATVAQIQGANDAALQTNVNTIVPILVDALAAAKTTPVI